MVREELSKVLNLIETILRSEKAKIEDRLTYYSDS